MRFLQFSVLFLLIITMAAPAVAESWPHERDGFTIGFNIGGGSAKIKPTEGEESDGSGGYGAFRLGWAISNQFLLGLESGAWLGEAETGLDGLNADLTLSSYLLNFTWYPGAKGWFIRAGFGGGSSEYSTKIDGLEVSVEDDGSAFGFGAGHEWRLTRKFALGVAVDYSTLDLDVDDFDFWGFSAQFNWYF